MFLIYTQPKAKQSAHLRTISKTTLVRSSQDWKSNNLITSECWPWKYSRTYLQNQWDPESVLSATIFSIPSLPRVEEAFGVFPEYNIAQPTWSWMSSEPEMLPGDKWKRKKFRKVITSTCTCLMRKIRQMTQRTVKWVQSLHWLLGCLEQPTGLASAIKRSCQCQ